MQLRLRSFETKETLKIEVPNPCTLHHLKELLSQKLPSPPRSSVIHLSLNRRDDLTTSSPQESIQSIGITSGDLIYFTTNPNGFSVPTQVTPQVAVQSLPKPQQFQSSQTLNPNSIKQDQTLKIDDRKADTGTSSNPNSEEVAESMEIDVDLSFINDVGKSFSVPSFLRKVFTEELRDDDGRNHKLLAISVRAVLLESGFVEIDHASSSSLIQGNSNFNLQQSLYLTSFHYTLPEIKETAVTNSVKIKFQNLGKYCKVYGSLKNGTTVHSVVLNEDKLVPFLNVVWANCGQVVQTMEENNTISTILPETEVFEFWRKTKDRIALPLLIDLCDKAGLELPPCFMRLPTELKLKILELVSGVDIAKVSCVCSELRYLASSDALWKQKYIEQFGNVEASINWRSFKERFAASFESRKRKKVTSRSFIAMRRIVPHVPFGAGPGHFPRIIGGDYDLLPNIGPRGPLGLPGGGRRLRNMMPNCDLAGFGL